MLRKNNFFAFAGFSKPGFHPVIIFEPISQEFFVHNAFIKARVSELKTSWEDQPIEESGLLLNDDMLPRHCKSIDKSTKLQLPVWEENDGEAKLLDAEEFVFKNWIFENSQKVLDKLFASDAGFLTEELQEVALALEPKYHFILEVYKAYVAMEPFQDSSDEKLRLFL